MSDSNKLLSEFEVLTIFSECLQQAAMSAKTLAERWAPKNSGEKITLYADPIETSPGLEPTKPDPVTYTPYPVADDKALRQRVNRAQIDCTIAEFYSLLSRALNTHDPQTSAQWAVELHDKLFRCDIETHLTFRLTP